jgi:hypothetical protein
MELREAFANLLTKIDPLVTVRGNIFNVDFGGSEEDISTTKSDTGRGNSLFNSQKRAGTNLIKEKTSSSKRSKNQCPVCEIRGHTLPDCWYLFEGKRPKGFKAGSVRMKKVHKRVEDNKDLAA